MKKWEYEYKHFSPESVINKNHLNEMGNDGWELISVIALPKANLYYFKREKVEIVSPVDDH